nr:putative glycosyl transferase, family 14 [Tanacetum cinerariifolium]
MSDEDLVTNVMKVSTENATTPHKGIDLFTIYVHTHPSYNETIPRQSVFHDTRITSQPVSWGDMSMVDAERRLLANALLDPLNQRFVLLSDSCIPLFNFTVTYNYLISSNLSYVSSYDEKGKSGHGRYNPQMWPDITIHDWRKGSQWFEVNRTLALGIVADKKYYSLFKEFCHPPCYNDEQYLPTLANILYGEMNSNRSVTHVDWSKVGPHPRRYVASEITAEFLNSIRFGSKECIYNGNPAYMCFLFSRKFAWSALKPLITLAPLLFGVNP